MVVALIQTRGIKMNKPEIEFALTKNACPVCTKQTDGDIVVNKYIGERYAEKVRQLHGQVTGYAYCGDCKNALEKGAVFLIEIDPALSEINNGFVNPEKAHRTGRIWGIKKEAVLKIFDVEKIDKDIVFIDEETAQKIGLGKQTK
jgi:hypothetical protein